MRTIFTYEGMRQDGERVNKLMGGFLLAGTIVGAGVLGLPYALTQSGFILGTCLLILSGFFAYLSASYIGVLVYQQGQELPLHTIIQRYLGNKMAYLTMAAVLFSSYGALLAYPLAVGEIVSSLFHFPSWLASLLFLLGMSLLTSQKLNTSNKVNAAITTLLILLLLWVIFKSLPYMQFSNLWFFSPSHLLSAFGVIIFAFAGHVVIPSVIYYMNINQNEGIKVIKWAIIGVGIIYLGFFVVTIGVMGRDVSSIATIGLGQTLGTGVALAGQFFAIFAILTSFFGMAISLQLTLEDQFKLRPLHSLAIIVVPLAFITLYLSAHPGTAFINILHYAGGIGSALYAGFIPALVFVDRRYDYKIPLGRAGAYCTLIFYGMAILYTIFFS